LYIKKGDVIEVEGKFLINRLYDCRITSGLPKVDFEDNTDFLINSFYGDEDTFDDEDFILNGEVEDINFINDFSDPEDFCENFGLNYENFNNGRVIKIKSTNKDVPIYIFMDNKKSDMLKLNDKFAIKGAYWKLKNKEIYTDYEFFNDSLIIFGYTQIPELWYNPTTK